MASPPSSRRQKPSAAANQPLISPSTQSSILSASSIIPVQSPTEGQNISPSVASPAQLTSPPPHANAPLSASPRSERKRKLMDDPVASLTGFGGDSGGPTQPSEGPAEGSSAPPPKKTRTNTPWTPAEEKRLKELRDAGTSWSEIAKTFPNRTEGSVKKHWYKDMHYAEFDGDESAALLEAIKEYDAQKWKIIGQKVGKPAKACEQYARDHFAGRI